MNMNPRPKRALFVDATNPSTPDRLTREAELAPWEVHWANSADTALAELHRTGYDIDVLVCGARLGALDARAFAAQVKRIHPRIETVLVEEHGLEGGLQWTLGESFVIDQATARRELKTVLERASGLSALMNTPAVARICGSLDRLPPVPRTYWALIQAAGDANTSVADIGRIVEADPAMSAKVLQLVNSAFFGLSRRMTSISQAVGILGINLLKGLVLTAHVFKAMDDVRPRGLSLEHFQNYSIRIARLARKFVVTRELGDEAFTVGMVHDIGKLVLALRQPADFERVMDRIAQTGDDTPVVEREVFGVCHSEVGAFLLATWGLPISVVEGVAFHHDLDLIPGTQREVLAAVHAADALTGIISCGDPEDRLNLRFIESASLLGEVERWRKLVQADVELQVG